MDNLHHNHNLRMELLLAAAVVVVLNLSLVVVEEAAAAVVDTQDKYTSKLYKQTQPKKSFICLPAVLLFFYYLSRIVNFYMSSYFFLFIKVINS